MRGVTNAPSTAPNEYGLCVDVGAARRAGYHVAVTRFLTN